jgi:hypothetical protein
MILTTASRKPMFGRRCAAIAGVDYPVSTRGLVKARQLTLNDHSNPVTFAARCENNWFPACAGVTRRKSES